MTGLALPQEPWLCGLTVNDLLLHLVELSDHLLQDLLWEQSPREGQVSGTKAGLAGGWCV